jgi:uncharacterized damage-inducible protein DinB
MVPEIPKTKWFERKFDFSFRPGIFPSIMERLRGTPARLEEMVRSYPGGILTVRKNDAWSIQDHIGHLADLDELHDGRIDDYIAGLETMRQADLKNTKTWEAGHNKKQIEDLLKSFRSARKQFCDRLESLGPEILVRESVHPRLNVTMRLVDMALFVAEHDDHHLSCIRELGRS